MAAGGVKIAGAARSARSAARGRTACGRSTRTAAPGSDDGSNEESRHGDPPRVAPAPPRSSGRREASARARLPSRSGPLRDAVARENWPAADAPTRAPLESLPSGGWRLGASRAVGSTRTRRIERERTNRPHRTRRPSHSPRTARIGHPRRSSRSGWTPGPTDDTLTIGDRVAARSPRGLGCFNTRAFTFSSARSTSSAAVTSSTTRIDQIRRTSSDRRDLSLAPTRVHPLEDVHGAGHGTRRVVREIGARERDRTRVAPNESNESRQSELMSHAAKRVRQHLHPIYRVECIVCRASVGAIVDGESGAHPNRASTTATKQARARCRTRGCTAIPS